MHPKQEVRMTDIAKRRERLDAWLKLAMELALRDARTEPEVDHENGATRRYRIWSDGTLSVDVELEPRTDFDRQHPAGLRRRTDIFGAILSEGDVSLDAWNVMVQVDGEGPGILPLREPNEKGKRAVAIFTYWEGAREDCLTVRCLLAEWLATLTSIERDELLLEREKG